MNPSNPNRLIAYSTDSQFAEVKKVSANKNQILPKGKLSFPLCCCPDSEDISKWQFSQYQNFFQFCNEQFDINKEEHKQILIELESIGKEMMIRNNKTGSVWRFLGFQSDKPENDLRDGPISAEFMLYALNHRVLNDEHAFVHPVFQFALSCIKIIFNVEVFLVLLDEINMKFYVEKQKYPVANRKQIRRYCLTDGYQKELFFELASVLLGYVYKQISLQVDISKREKNYLIIEPIIGKSVVC